METRDDILKELREIAPKLASMDKSNPYKLHEGYFVQFKSRVLEQVKLNEVREELKVSTPMLAGMEKKLPSNVPVAYFNGFTGALFRRIRGNEVRAELVQMAPELSRLQKVNPFRVPVNYFSAFPARILKEINKPESAGIPFRAPWLEGLNKLLERALGTIFKPGYTVAFAGLATVMIISVMMFMKVEQCNDLECRFAQLSTAEINNYLENKSDAYSDEVFEGKFDENPIPAADNQTKLPIYKDALKDVDDAELNQAIAD